MRIINALLSCPGDVYQTFQKELYETIENINIYLKPLLDVEIVLKHYTGSSYSQVGKSAQDHLDDTLVNDCDFCIACFYHKLGTPTKLYKSGTDEEIHLMLEAGKDVSIFRIYDNDLDKGDDKLEEYFKELSSECFYRPIIGRNNIKTIIRNDLINYLSHSFKVGLINTKEPFKARDYLYIKFGLGKARSKIIDLINKIIEIDDEYEKSLLLAKTAQEALKNNAETNVLFNNRFSDAFADIQKTIAAAAPMAGFYQDVAIENVFSEESKSLLNRFVSENDISLDEHFLSFNGRVVKKYVFSVQGNEYIVDDKSVKDKISYLESLSTQLHDYFVLLDYVELFKDIVFIPFAIENATTSNQTNINIFIKVKKDNAPFLHLLFPDSNKELLLLMCVNFLHKSFIPHAYGCLEYNHPPVPHLQYHEYGLTDFVGHEKVVLNTLLDYQIDTNDKEISINCKYPQISPGEKYMLPTFIPFATGIKNIAYTITGSNLSRPVNGKIVFDEPE